MVRVLELKRSIAHTAFAVAFLTGCSSSGSDELISAIRDDLTGNGNQTDTRNPATSINRAQITKLGVALIRVQESLFPATNLLVAFRKTGPQVTYVLRAERRLILHGALIQSTHGFGDNLDPIGVNAADPIAFPRPLGAWPQSVSRQYTLSDRGAGTATTVTCTFAPGERGTLEIVERKNRVQEMSETCRAPGIEFTNRHHVDVKTGAIWRSQQWSGPRQGMLTYEILEPLD